MKTNMRLIFTLATFFLLSSLQRIIAQTCSGVVANVTANTASQTATTSTWTVPAGGPYIIRVTAAGARGGGGNGSGGSGAIMTGTFIVQSGQQLNITAGAPGGDGIAVQGYLGGGGGGGSGVDLDGTQTVLVIAGGGGGASGGNGGSGQVTSDGQ